MLRVTQLFTGNLLCGFFGEFTILLITINYKNLIICGANLYSVVEHDVVSLGDEH